MIYKVQAEKSRRIESNKNSSTGNEEENGRRIRHRQRRET